LNAGARAGGSDEETLACCVTDSSGIAASFRQVGKFLLRGCGEGRTARTGVASRHDGIDDSESRIKELSVKVGGARQEGVDGASGGSREKRSGQAWMLKILIRTQETQRQPLFGQVHDNGCIICTLLLPCS
jgi:hypothetical protein